MKNTFFALNAAALLLAALPAQAALQARDFDGNTSTVEGYYDTHQNITWFADALSVVGTAYEVTTAPGSGRMTWQNAMSWADSLTLGGHTDWRLPSTLLPDASCSAPFSYVSTGLSCAGSELGHLAVVDGIGPASPGFNLGTADGPENNYYWSQTEIVEEPGGVYVYNIATPYQGGNWKVGASFALAVHDGDVGTAISPVPEPETYALMLAGLGMLGFIGRRSQRRG